LFAFIFFIHNRPKTETVCYFIDSTILKVCHVKRAHNHKVLKGLASLTTGKWGVDFDIIGLFDNIDHQLLMKALRIHCSIKWILLYVERWLKASITMPTGEIQNREKGTPQGGVISPLLANLFLDYAFDK